MSFPVNLDNLPGSFFIQTYNHPQKYRSRLFSLVSNMIFYMIHKFQAILSIMIKVNFYCKISQKSLNLMADDEK